MRLRISVPTEVVLDRKVTYVQAEDPSGRFGMLPGHERFLTVVVPSILVYRYREGSAEREAYAAVRHGTLRVSEDAVELAVREAILSEDLADLEKEMRRLRKGRSLRAYRSARSLYQMQIGAWRRLMEYEDVRSR